MTVFLVLRAGILAGTVLAVQPAFAAEVPAPPSATANDEFGVPVFPYDITDRPYEVIGPVHAGVRKATIFSSAPDQGKIYHVLWKDAQKMHADAVIKVKYGDPHITAMSWGSVSVDGIAIRFTGPAQSTKPAN